MLDVKKLKGRMAECGITQSVLAKTIGISSNTMTNKMSGKRDFNLGEIDRICDALCIVDNELKAQIFLA